MKKIYLNRLVLFTLLILIFSVFNSCSKPPENQSAEADSGGPAAAKKPEGAGENDNNESETGRTEAAFISDPEGSDFLLYSDIKTEPVVAEDFEIGRLQAGFGNDGITADILNAAEKFLRGFESGLVDSSLIGSAKKRLVERIMREGLEISIPEDFRIGEINTLDEPVWARIKMYGKDGWGTGVMYFIREDGWKVYDFHLDFSDLQRPDQIESELWDPSNRQKVEVEYGKYN